MKFSFFLPLIVGSVILTPALFAETSGTGTTTGTGSTSTGTTSTGTTNTGTTSTGSTSTGTTATGTTSTGTTSTGTIRCGSGNIISNLEAREVYLAEMMRLISEKKVAYQAALTLTGTAKTEAIKAANVKFRVGQKMAIEKFNLVRKENYFSRKICKKLTDDKNLRQKNLDDKKSRNDSDDDNDEDEDDDNDNDRGRGNDDKKSIKKIEKEIKKISKKNNGRGRD